MPFCIIVTARVHDDQTLRKHGRQLSKRPAQKAAAGYFSDFGRVRHSHGAEACWARRWAGLLARRRAAYRVLKRKPCYRKCSGTGRVTPIRREQLLKRMKQRERA